MKELQDGFQRYISEMDVVLDALARDAESRGLELNFSVSSVNVLESLITDLLRLGVDTHDRTIDRGARYLGEVFRRQVGGNWTLCDDRRFHDFGLPVVHGYSSKGLLFSPVRLVHSFVRLPKPGVLTKAIDGHAEWADLVPKVPEH